MTYCPPFGEGFILSFKIDSLLTIPSYQLYLKKA
ncbi:hypothetical protein FOPPYZMZ_CDS0255 [Pseudomonas phage 9Ps-7B]|nr:hypothetical protein [Pseudomonas phage ANB1]WRQ05690.1 hypothetical protein IPCDMZAV_CDS0167 [Pseudomonas phage 6B]WRQ06187.1 hypothetical protein QAMIJHJT_CDS0256 [Pseudomonas phage 9-Ps-8B]WRQ06595.1 hypothetical protein FOPPYZMZ_CDS0255 [Pseudomonas phage 9Ps-7B]WRQ06946.1 hypothetical protein ZBUARNPM_CDS0197 [Pseudomonas phage 14Ps5-6]